MSLRRRKTLFVSYGGGHVQMVLPVARALQASDWAEPVVLGLTTAAEPVRQAGLPLLQVKDFVEPGDAPALAWGEQLLAAMQGAVIDRDESVAYLGLSFQELVDRHGEAEAWRAYEEKGRHAFLPVYMLERILRRVRPDVVVSTSSPRAEHAAFLAAREVGIPSLCLIDSFLQDEAVRLGAPGYSDAICVFNASVRDLLIAHGAAATQVFCTGNPAFDTLQAPATVAAGRELRERMGWAGKTVVLVPSQHFQPYHPVAGAWAGHDLPQRLEAVVQEWVSAQDDALLCLRPRPGEMPATLSNDPRTVFTGGPDWPLAPLLHAVDIVATVNSTVGLEGHLAGARVVQVLGTPFDGSTPWKLFGVADHAVPLAGVPAALDALCGLPRASLQVARPATPQVVEILRGLAG